jgi:hypothetical protein
MSLSEDYNELNELLSNPPTLKDRQKKQVSDSCSCESPCEGEQGKKFAQGYVQWSTSDGINFIPSSDTQKTLLPGVYEIRQSPSIGIYFEKIPTKTEGLIRFPDTNSDLVVHEIQKFWTRQEYFSKYGLSYKRGILLYGPPGGGKSCTVQLIMADVVHRGGIVLNFCHPSLFMEGVRALRQVQPDTPVVTAMEDIDSILEHYSESSVLNILDGVTEVNWMVFLATTNYPERLGSRIINRPSRFDKRFKIGHPSAESRRLYFEHLIGNDDPTALGIDIKRWVKDTAHLSIAHLRELFIAVVILNDSYEQALEILQSMKEKVDVDDDDNKIGFTRRD